MGNKLRSGLKKQLFRAAFAKTTLHQAKLACEYILNHPEMDQGTYHVLTTGFTITYTRLFDGGNEGIGHLSTRFQIFADPALQNTHDALCAARNLFVAHLNAGYKYCDEQGRERDQLLALTVVVGPVGADGKSEVRTQITAPEVPRDIINRYKALCENIIQKIAVEEKALLERLYDGTSQLKVGVNRVNIFDES